MDSTDDFSRLSLAIPNAQQYLLPLAFLGMVCHDPESECFQAEGAAILGSVDVPPEIWALSKVFIKDVEVKTAVLKDIIAWLTLSPHDVAILTYYQQLLVAYAVYDTKTRPGATPTHLYSDNALISDAGYNGQNSDNLTLPGNNRQGSNPNNGWRNKPRDFIKSKRFPFSKKQRDPNSDMVSIMDDNASAVSAVSPESRSLHIVSRLKRFGSSRSMHISPIERHPVRWLPTDVGFSSAKNPPTQPFGNLSPPSAEGPLSHFSKPYVTASRVEQKVTITENGFHVEPVQPVALNSHSSSSDMVARPSLLEGDGSVSSLPHRSGSSVFQHVPHSAERGIPAMTETETSSTLVQDKVEQPIPAIVDYFAEVCNLYTAIKTLVMQPQSRLNAQQRLQVADFVRKDVVRFIAIDVLHMVLDYAHAQLHSFDRIGHQMR